jgi:N-acetylmuramoyl-L-alanine amidase
MFSLMQNIFLEQSTSLASKIQTEYKESHNRQDRGVKQAGFWVLFNTTMPSVLTETGFITNPDEEKFLNSNEGQDKIASAIFRACIDYLEDIDSKSSKFPVMINTPEPVTSSNSEYYRNNHDIIFMIQVASSPSRIEIKPENFNGLKNIIEIEGADRMKYATGNFNNYDSAVTYRKEIEPIFPDAFVIAVKDNKILPLQQALDQTKELTNSDNK